MLNGFKVLIAATLLTVTLLIAVDSKHQVPEIVCVPITECPVLLQLLKRRPVSAKNLALIYASHCGFEDVVQKVWCLKFKENFRDDDNETLTLFSNVSNASDKAVVDKVENKVRAINTEYIFPSSKVCGQYIEKRIVGGETTELDEFPWTALFYYLKKNGDFTPGCGGALITNRHVLTAAHCVTRKKPSYVMLGDYHIKNATDCFESFDDSLDCSPPPVKVNIEYITVHPEWHSTERPFYHDIALIRLEREVDFTDFVAPICLPHSGDNNSEAIKASDAMLTVTGWGFTESRRRSDVKLKVNIPVVNRSQCSHVLGRMIGPGQICAGGQTNKDACKGDSGSPLMYLDKEKQSWSLTGIVSLGTSTCGLHNVPGVYSFVPYYMDWIVRSVQET